ncbi:MAG: signal peptidase II [Clostridiales bacterium]|nr:signal peptidase II [Clostridiales bacterium]
MAEKIGNLVSWILLSLVLILLDQYTKTLAVLCLKGQEPIVIVRDVFELLYSENRGAAFGIMQGQQTLFAVIGLVVFVFAGYVMLRLPGWSVKRYIPLKICVIMVTAGALGNMVDRLSVGYVVDFLYFVLIDFPIFNVADIYVTTAAAALIFLICFYYRDEELEMLYPGSSGGFGKGE